MSETCCQNVGVGAKYVDPVGTSNFGWEQFWSLGLVLEASGICHRIHCSTVFTHGICNFDYLHYCVLLFSVPFVLLCHDFSSMKIEIEIESRRPTPCSVPFSMYLDLKPIVAGHFSCIPDFATEVQVIAEDGSSEKAGKGKWRCL